MYIFFKLFLSYIFLNFLFQAGRYSDLPELHGATGNKRHDL